MSCSSNQEIKILGNKTEGILSTSVHVS